MRSDAFSNVLLALIAAGIFFSVALDLAGVGQAREPADSPDGRYRIVAIGMTRQLVLLDTHTGRTWRSPFKSSEWTPVEPPPGSVAAEGGNAEEDAEPEPSETEAGGGSSPPRVR